MEKAEVLKRLLVVDSNTKMEQIVTSKTSSKLALTEYSSSENKNTPNFSPCLLCKGKDFVL